MAVLVFATAATGVYRYFKLKAILAQKVPPRGFGRVTLRPLAVVLVATAVATTVGVCSQQWVHGHAASPPAPPVLNV